MNINPLPQLPVCNLPPLTIPAIPDILAILIAALKALGIIIPPPGFPPKIPFPNFPCPFTTPPLP